MGSYFHHLWNRSWDSALALGSSTRISLLYLSFGAILLTFIIEVAYEWWRGDMNHTAFREALKKWPSYLFPVLALSVIWGGILFYSVVITVYKDHVDLVEANRLLKQTNEAYLSRANKEVAVRTAVVELGLQYDAQHSGAIMVQDKIAWINAGLVARGFTGTIALMEQPAVPSIKMFDFGNSRFSGKTTIRDNTLNVGSAPKRQ